MTASAVIYLDIVVVCSDLQVVGEIKMIDILRQAARPFRKPVFCAVVILTLGLGVGSTTAIYSLFYQVIWRDLPVARPHQLMVLHVDGGVPGNTRRTNFESVFSYPMYKVLRKASIPGVQGLLARTGMTVDLTRDGQNESAWVEAVSGNFFEVLGLHPFAGRLLSEEDDTLQGGNDVAALGYDYWKQHYSDTNIVGNKVLVNGHPLVIVGIAPPEFRGVVSGRTAEIYIPLSMLGIANPGFNGFNNVKLQWLNIIGRVGNGVSLETTEAAINTVWTPAISDDILQMGAKLDPRAPPPPIKLRHGRTGINQLERNWKQPLMILIYVASGLLLIACANLVGLFMVQWTSRRQEMAIRLSLGASRRVIVSQLLVEGILIAVLGSACAVVFSIWITVAIFQLAPSNITNGWIGIGLNWPMFIYSLTLSVLVGVCVTIWPARQLSAEDPIAALKGHGSSLIGQSHQRRWRKWLVVLQIASSIALLAVAGLFGKSLNKLLRHDVGFNEKNLLTFTLDPRLHGQTNERSIALYDQVLERLSASLEVVSASFCKLGPYGDATSSTNVNIEGYHQSEHEDMNSRMNLVAPGYFHTLGMPLEAGREFTAFDTPNGQKVAVVNVAFVKRFLSGRDPIGTRISTNRNGAPDISIVGVVRDAQLTSLRETPRPYFYLPFHQSAPAKDPSTQAVFVVRARVNDGHLATTIRDVVSSVDKTLPVINLGHVDVLIRDSAYEERALAVLTSAAALLALSLMGLGLYGVVSYMVESRTAEIGIRMALGADRRSTLFLIIREVLWVIGVGLTAGVLGGLALSRYAASQLYQVEPMDLSIFSGATGVLLVIALAAVALPAIRAVRIDPVQAIRYE